MSRGRAAVGLLRGAAIALLALAAACASRPLQREGMFHVQAGRYEQGLAMLEEAVRDNAGDAALRLGLLTAREQAVGQLLALARTAIADGRTGEARAHHARALAIAPQDARVIQAIRDLDAREARAQRARLEPPAQAPRASAGEAADPPQLKSRMTSPVTLQFRDASVKMVLDVLSRASGINFILDKEIKGDTRITIYVHDVAVEDAIDLALVQSQLEKKILSDNTVLIYPNTPQKLREYQDLVVRSFYLVNADAKQTAATLKTILKVKDMQVDDRLNMIVLRETPDTVRLAEKLIRAQDLAEPEVVLEIEVLEINRTRAIELGMSWPDTFTWLAADSTLGGLPFGQHVTRDRIGVNAGVALKLRQESGVANLLSNPRIRVKNRDKARILVGDRVPIITATVTPGAVTPITSESITYLDVGLKLETEPTVLLDDDVSIKLNLEVSTLGDSVRTNSGSVAYRVGTRTVSTSLRLKDGETQILMGLIRDEERRRANGVPGIMDMPVLGRLFSTPKNETEKTEIALAITPRIVRNVHQPELHETEFWSGTEASIKARRPVLGSGVTPQAPLPSPPAESREPSRSPPAVLPDATPAPPAALPQATPAPPAALPEATPAPPPAGAQARPLQLAWAAPPSARVGEQFVLAMDADAPSLLVGVAMTLKFDPSALEVLKIEEGDLLAKDGTRTRFNQAVDAVRGRIAVGISRPRASPAQGRGRLFSVTFMAKAASSASRIQLTSVAPLGPEDAALPFSAGGPIAIALTP